MKPADLAHREPSVEARRWLLGLSVGVVVAYLALFLSLLWKVGPVDQDQFLVFHELQFWNSSFFGISKQWTPLMCGGLSLAGEPQVPFMSLSMSLAYLCGPFWALKAATALYFVAGWIGAYLYAGLWLRKSEPRFLAASLFIGNGFFICRFGYGHMDFIPFLTLPLLLWILHRVSDSTATGPDVPGPIKQGMASLMMGALVALAIDGSPVAIIHLLVWVGLYAVALGVVRRSWRPPGLFICAVALAMLLDAGYLWPMLKAQTLLPRLTPDRFTSVLSLIWFALIPMRGKVLPANGLGHELSVYIGPVLAWLLWRDRDWLRGNLPDSLCVPLVFVACASIVLGMGSLRPLHVPPLLSPFDWLRPLPGFRSLGVTGRYWGFLALPLSLWGAAVLWRFGAQDIPIWRLRALLGVMTVLQLGFQLETVLTHWLPSRTYHVDSTSTGGFLDRPQHIRYVVRGTHMQGELITPTQGVLDCYDMDDFVHAEMAPGSTLIKAAQTNSGRTMPVRAFSGHFVTWSHIVLSETPSAELPKTKVRLVLWQAYHPYWQAESCTTEAADKGNLALNCPAALFKTQVVNLRFDDQLSEVAAAVSRFAWQSWLYALALLLFLTARARFARIELSKAVRQAE